MTSDAGASDTGAPDPRPVLAAVRDAGAAAGLAINPTTPVSDIAPYLADCDLVLVMSVMPGFGGQSFERSALEKLRILRHQSSEMLLEIDGGINHDTVRACAQAVRSL